MKLEVNSPVNMLILVSHFKSIDMSMEQFNIVAKEKLAKVADDVKASGNNSTNDLVFLHEISFSSTIRE